MDKTHHIRLAYLQFLSPQLRFLKIKKLLYKMIQTLCIVHHQLMMFSEWFICNGLIQDLLQWRKDQG
ncbi:hypothetical protein D3C86_1107450 [compost metagenome]